MKGMAYLFLLLGLLSSQVFGQSAPKNQRRVVVSCVGLSCSSSVSPAMRGAKHGVVLGSFKSVPMVPSSMRTGTHEVILGCFKPLPTKSRRVVLSQVSQLEQGKMETLHGTGDLFALPAVTVRR
jgi:uncharacterized protein (UPF0147 family)